MASQPDRQKDRQPDMTKLVLAFHNSANAPKKYKASNQAADWLHDLEPLAIDCRNETAGVTAQCAPIPVILRANVTDV